MANWDERYRGRKNVIKGPVPLLADFVARLQPGRALDLASGTGRHAIFLAERGWRVTAVDGSSIGIDLARETAAARNVEVDWVVANLEHREFEIEPEAYDLIGIFYYLQRDLFPEIRAGVRHGGVVIASIQMVDESPDLKPMNPDFLLQPGELRAEFSGWEVLHAYEGTPTEEGHHRQVAEIVARKGDT